MNEDIGGFIVLCGILLFLVFVFAVTYAKGERRGECRTRVEYALTATDTLTLARVHPECSRWLFTEAK